MHEQVRRESSTAAAPAAPAPAPAAAVRDVAARQQHRAVLHGRAGREAGPPIVRRSTNLVVGAADDRAEREADRAADSISWQLNGTKIRRGTATAPASDTIGLEGGELDDSTSAEIQRQRGRGERLRPDLADSIGGALGTDLSGVRVHTGAGADRLAGKISASAFTLGSDVFFSKGAYRPDDAGGQHLLAHELAHVGQQRSGLQRSVIRRAIGFEFETNMIVRKDSPTGKVPLAKMESIKRYSEGFAMEADENSVLGSTIEFVVDHVQESTDGRKKLVKAMDKMTGLARTLAKKPYPGGTMLGLAADPPEQLHKALSISRKDITYVPQGGNVTANPQATGGIAMDKVVTLLSEIGNGAVAEGQEEHQTASDSLERISPDRPGELAATVTGLEGSEELKGIVAMLVGYLKFGSAAAGDPLNYAKLISASTMIRTDFGTWFSRLPDDERKGFLENGRGMGFVDVVLTAAGMTGAGGAAVFERGVRKSYDKNSPDYAVKRTDAKLLVTRKDWLLSITRGGDALSAYWNGDMKGVFEGLGRLGPAMDQVGDEVGTDEPGSGVIMEFRRMNQDVPYTKWTEMATGIFDYIRSLNARQTDG